MSGEKLTKDDLSEYLVKFQRLQRICMGCATFRIITEKIAVHLFYANQELDSERVFFSLFLGDFKAYAENMYDKLKNQLIKDNWL